MIGLRARNGRRSSRGQAMTEFALVVPIIFALVFGVLEAGRFMLYYELLQDAAREGARYAIVHGNRSTCPSGPPPPGETNPCDPSGANIKAAVDSAALDLAGSGSLTVFDPVWTSRGSLHNPMPGDSSTGHNGRGEYITVFVDFTYDTLVGQLLGTDVLPSMNIKAETTLVINT